MKNKSVEEVVSVICEVLKDDTVKEHLSFAQEVVAGIVPFPASAILGVTNKVLSELSKHKLGYMLKGLSTELNIETQINSLYNYVTASSERAYTVANIFRKTINAESTRVCIIYGMIIAEHLKEKSDFLNEELLLCRALENATDFDLINFEKMMNEYVVSGEVEFDKIQNIDKNDMKLTADWCVYNRIFSGMPGKFRDGYIAMEMNYHITPIAERLLGYINKIMQIWNYGSTNE